MAVVLLMMAVITSVVNFNVKAYMQGLREGLKNLNRHINNMQGFRQSASPSSTARLKDCRKTKRRITQTPRKGSDSRTSP